jgi:hypothetical protein
VWGDGLVEQPISGFYGHATWDDVSADELIMLLPALAGRRRSAPTARDPAFFVQRTLVARIFHCALRMASLIEGGSPTIAGRRAAIDTIIRSQVVTMVSPLDVASAGETFWVELFGFEPADLVYRPEPDKPRPSLRNEWLYELSVLASLDRLLSDAHRLTRDSPRSELIRVLPSDALIASIYSSINAAYIYPELEYMHEMLMLGAWLGVLERGRPALLPDRIATRLLRYLTEKPNKVPASDEGKCEALLRVHVSLGGPRETLANEAQWASKTGEARVINPTPPATPQYIRSLVINAALKRRLEASPLM